MSFAYLTLYTGDYLRDTRHLSCCEHGIYLLLLMHCWDCRGPVPLDERKICGITGARSGDEIEALRRVLGEFFTRMEDGWYNRRIMLEIERANAISGKRKYAGIKGFQAKAKQVSSKWSASASTPNPTTNTTTTPNPGPNPDTKKVKNTTAQSALLCPPDVSEEVWLDFIAIRRAKHSPLTATALKGIEREAGKAGLTLQAALEMSCARGWQSFRADWVKNRITQRTSAMDEEMEAFKEMVLSQSEKDITNG